MQSKVRCCLWLALETCLKPLAIHSLWFPLLGLGAWCGKYQCVPQGQLLPTVVPGTGQENLETPRDLHPPAGCLLGLVTVRTSSCTPQQGLSSTGWGKRDSCRWGYCFPPGWCYMERRALPEKDGFFSMGDDWAQGYWWLTFHLSPRATNPRLSSHGSIPLFPPSTGAQGKWLQTKFCVLALYKCVCISSHLCLTDRNCAVFHSRTLRGYPFWSGTLG